MAEVTVQQLADVVGVSVERLLKQMQEAGIKGKADGSKVSEGERQDLLTYLKRSHGETTDSGEPKKITLKRKTTSQLKVSGASGKKKTINIEVRKKRTYVKRADAEGEAAPAEQVAEQPVSAAVEQAAARCSGRCCPGGSEACGRSTRCRCDRYQGGQGR